jgi:Ribbon-helix-helix protein, copG family
VTRPLSLRLPTSELAALRTEASRSRTSVSELIRRALKAHLQPTPQVTLSASCQYGLTISTNIPMYQGGVAAPAEVTIE